MNTIGNPVDLSHTYGCHLFIKDIHNGRQVRVFIERKNLNYLKFYIHPHFYTLAKDWKISQPIKYEPRGFIYVKELLDIAKRDDPIIQKTGKIYNKFNKLKDFIIIEDSGGHIGVPECGAWVDKNLTISL